MMETMDWETVVSLFWRVRMYWKVLLLFERLPKTKPLKFVAALNLINELFNTLLLLESE